MRAEHIMTRRSLYTHHGVWIGNDTVIHYSGPKSNHNAPSVRKTSLESFSDGNTVYKVVYKKRLAPNDSVQKALSKLGEKQYNLSSNNCEHFATWCITGKHASRQSEAVKAMLTQGTLETVFRSAMPFLAGPVGISVMIVKRLPYLLAARKYAYITGVEEFRV